MADTQYFTVSHLDRRTIARIFSKISIDSVTGCWNWIGAQNTYGYGQIWYQGKDALTHRLLYAWTVEPLPRGHGASIPQLDHFICDNRRCCNPCHVRLVSLAENVLRSTSSIGGYFARQTHCKRGHPLTPENRYRSPAMHTDACFTCLRARWKAQNDARKLRRRGVR